MNLYDIESEYYDLFYFSYKKDINIYREFLCPKVLELFTGTGRILYYLNPEYGVGIDINENMLKRARENINEKGIKFVKADARYFDLKEQFCLIIIGLNSLMMFPREERIKILSSAAKHLTKEGRIVVDLLNPYMMVEGIVHHGDTVEYEGVYYSRFFVPRWKEDHWEILYFYDIVRDEVVRRKHASLDLYPVYVEHLEDEAKTAGLVIERMYGDYDLSEYEDESNRIIAIMRRADD